MAAEKTTVIGCPVSEDFRPARARAPSEPFTALQVGTGANKNLERVATALVGLPVHLHVIGHITEKQRSILDRSRLSYSESADLSEVEIRGAYQSSSLLIFVSTYEGFGLPILEAQACGIPVVTSEIPPMREIAGDAAVFVNPLDTASIHQGIKTILWDADLRATLGAAGPLNAVRYSPARIAAQYADTYRRLDRRRPF